MAILVSDLLRKLDAIPKSALEDIKSEIEKDSLSDVNGSKFIFVKRVNEIIDKHMESEE